jgi:hypothetical protein
MLTKRREQRQACFTETRLTRATRAALCEKLMLAGLIRMPLFRRWSEPC